jgi:flagellar hook-length control protein FliK
MITLQLPASAVKSAPAAAPGQSNPAATDADPADSATKPSLFAFLLAQRAGLTAAAIPGHKAGAKAATEEDAKAGTATPALDAAAVPAAAAPWMWLNQAQPRTAAGESKPDPKGDSATSITCGKDARAPAAAAITEEANKTALGPATAAAPSVATATPPKAAQDEISGLAAATETHTKINVSDLPAPVVAATQGPQDKPPVQAPPPAAAPVEVPIDSKIGTPRWTRDIHQSVSMLVQSRNSVAELRLTPEDMGPIQIRIDFSDAKPSVSISVQQTDTRNALDAALPRLREMMAESGINLGGSSVEQQSGRSGDPAGDQARQAGRHQGFEAAPRTAEEALPVTRAISLDQLVDTYA